MQRSSIKKLLFRLLGILIFLVILYHINTFDLFDLLKTTSIPLFFLSFLFIPVFVFVKGLRWRHILQTHDIRISLLQSFFINLIELAAVSTVSMPGTLIRTLGLRRSKLDIAQMIFSDKFFDLLLPVFIGTMSFLFLLSGTTDNLVLGIFISGILLLYGGAPSLARFWEICLELLAKIPFIQRLFAERRVQISLDRSVYLYSLAALLIYYFAIFFLCRSLDIQLSFFHVMLIEALVFLVRIVPFSFFGIGTRDLALVTVFTWFGQTAEQAIALSLLMLLLRLMILGCASAAGLLWSPAEI